ILCILAVEGCGYELTGGAHNLSDGGLHVRRRRASCLAHSTGRDVNTRHKPGLTWYPSRPASIAQWNSIPRPDPARLSPTPRAGAHQSFGDATQQTMCADAQFTTCFRRGKLIAPFATVWFGKAPFD